MLKGDSTQTIQVGTFVLMTTARDVFCCFMQFAILNFAKTADMCLNTTPQAPQNDA